jgi:hypothetical protein
MRYTGQHDAPSDTWMVGYMVPGTNTLSVLGDGYTLNAATSEIRRLRAAWQAEQQRQAQTVERHIVADFYSEENP